MIIIRCFKGMTIDLFSFAIDQHPIFIGTDQKTFESIKRAFARRTSVKEGVDRIARGIGILDNRRIHWVCLVIMQAIRRGNHRGNTAGSEFSGNHIL